MTSPALDARPAPLLVELYAQGGVGQPPVGDHLAVFEVEVVPGGPPHVRRRQRDGDHQQRRQGPHEPAEGHPSPLLLARRPGPGGAPGRGPGRGLGRGAGAALGVALRGLRGARRPVLAPAFRRGDGRISAGVARALLGPTSSSSSLTSTTTTVTLSVPPASRAAETRLPAAPSGSSGWAARISPMPPSGTMSERPSEHSRRRSPASTGSTEVSTSTSSSAPRALVIRFFCGCSAA